MALTVAERASQRKWDALCAKHGATDWRAPFTAWGVSPDELPDLLSSIQHWHRAIARVEYDAAMGSYNVTSPGLT